MTPKRRYYSAGVREALFMVSRGRCYVPGCSQRVLKMVDDDPSINVHIAHICAHSVDGPRFNEFLTERQCRSFGNLLLLCQAHHTPVDDKTKEDKYTVALLTEWKHQREGNFYQKLAGLDVLGREDLERLMAEAVTDTKTEILTAIAVVESTSKDTAATLQHLVAEMFDRPYLDLDAVAMLSDAAYALRHLQDSAPMLSDAAATLRNLEENASILLQASKNLGSMDAGSEGIHQSVVHLGELLQHANWGNTENYLADSEVRDQISAICTAAAQLELAAIELHSVSDESAVHSRNWLYFRWGLGIGAAVVIAIVIAFVVYQNRGA